LLFVRSWAFTKKHSVGEVILDALLALIIDNQGEHQGSLHPHLTMLFSPRSHVARRPARAACWAARLPPELNKLECNQFTPWSHARLLSKSLGHRTLGLYGITSLGRSCAVPSLLLPGLRSEGNFRRGFRAPPPWPIVRPTDGWRSPTRSPRPGGEGPPRRAST